MLIDGNSVMAYHVHNGLFPTVSRSIRYEYQHCRNSKQPCRCAILPGLAGERVVLERRGKPVAAPVSMEDLQLLEQLENEADLRSLRKAKSEGGKPIPLEQVAAELGINLKAPAKRKRSAG